MIALAVLVPFTMSLDLTTKALIVTCLHGTLRVSCSSGVTVKAFDHPGCDEYLDDEELVDILPSSAFDKQCISGELLESQVVGALVSAGSDDAVQSCRTITRVLADGRTTYYTLSENATVAIVHARGIDTKSYSVRFAGIDFSNKCFHRMSSISYEF